MPPLWQSKHGLVEHKQERELIVDSLTKQRVCGPKVISTLRSLARLPNAVNAVPTTRPFTWVATASELSCALSNVWEEIQRPGCGIVAVDTEHHSKCSYEGFLCLIQLSTLSQDVVIGKNA